jgi:hypothetical protein
MLLFLFVIMLVNLDEAARQKQFNGQWMISLACLGGIGGLIGWFLYRGEGAFPWNTPYPTGIAPGGIGNTEMIADVLFRDYLLPFEIASILLLWRWLGPSSWRARRVLRNDSDYDNSLRGLSAALFLIGAMGVLTRRNIVIILMSIELLLNAVNINLIAFSKYYGGVEGQVFAIFVICIAVLRPPSASAF